MPKRKPIVTKAAPEKKPHGRPSKHTPAIAALICVRLAAGESLRSVCRTSEMPSEMTVRTWALDDVGGFSSQYARAREIGYHGLFDEVLEIADTTQEGVTVTQKLSGVETRRGDMIEHRRLRVDARKWMLAKALPKIYGDKIEHEHTASTELLAALDAAGERARKR